MKVAASLKRSRGPPGSMSAPVTLSGVPVIPATQAEGRRPWEESQLDGGDFGAAFSTLVPHDSPEQTAAPLACPGPPGACGELSTPCCSQPILPCRCSSSRGICSEGVPPFSPMSCCTSAPLSALPGLGHEVTDEGSGCAGGLLAAPPRPGPGLGAL